MTYVETANWNTIEASALVTVEKTVDFLVFLLTGIDSFKFTNMH